MEHPKNYHYQEMSCVQNAMGMLLCSIFCSCSINEDHVCVDLLFFFFFLMELSSYKPNNMYIASFAALEGYL